MKQKACPGLSISSVVLGSVLYDINPFSTRGSVEWGSIVTFYVLLIFHNIVINDDVHISGKYLYISVTLAALNFLFW